MSVRLLCVDQTVTIRPNNLEPLSGYLCLLADTDEDINVLTWMPSDAISTVEREIYRKVHLRTRICKLVSLIVSVVAPISPSRRGINSSSLN